MDIALPVYICMCVLSRDLANTIILMSLLLTGHPIKLDSGRI